MLPTFIFWFIVWCTYQDEVVKDGGQCCFTAIICAYVTNVHLRFMYALHYEYVTGCCVVDVTYPYRFGMVHDLVLIRNKHGIMTNPSVMGKLHTYIKISSRVSE